MLLTDLTKTLFMNLYLYVVIGKVAELCFFLQSYNENIGKHVEGVAKIFKKNKTLYIEVDTGRKIVLLKVKMSK